MEFPISRHTDAEPSKEICSIFFSCSRLMSSLIFILSECETCETSDNTVRNGPCLWMTNSLVSLFGDIV